MADRQYPLATFQANNGTGLWEVFTWGLRVGGSIYHFTKDSFVVSCGTQERTETHIEWVEEDDDFAFWAALVTYQETGSWRDAGLAGWSLGGSSLNEQITHKLVSGNVQLSIGNLSDGRQHDLNLRYREDGAQVQVDAIGHFATVTLHVIDHYRKNAG